MHRKGLYYTISLLSFVICSCTGVTAVKNPTDKDKGIRYYRPKPYLLLSPVVEGQHSGQNVSISLDYLPDYSEEYALHINTGLNGSVSADIKLEDGWNLTGLNVKADPQTDDLIKAVGEFMTKIPKFTNAPGKGFIVKSSNVPLGYYEAVIGEDQHCRKQLYGWRYVGFVPYQRCPLDAGGQDGFCCNAEDAPLYGLVWENGTLTFKSLGSNISKIKPSKE